MDEGVVRTPLPIHPQTLQRAVAEEREGCREGADIVAPGSTAWISLLDDLTQHPRNPNTGEGLAGVRPEEQAPLGLRKSAQVTP